jgi:3-hydroxyisobutyrate dehydrogenase
MKVGFVGLGNVGGKLAGSVLRGGFSLIVRDLNRGLAENLLARGAEFGESPAAMAADCDLLITCLPSPAASASVMEGENGALGALGPGKVWLEMSTTDAAEVRRLGALVCARGGQALDCPVSGGCHRAATGNISIFAGGERGAFMRAFPILQAMGRRILHTGGLGSASVLKVVTNYLAGANLLSLCEALTAAKAAGLDLNVAFEAIRISSGNSFVHETESQVILNGSRDINFTMDLALKDMSLFIAAARRAGLELEIAPLLQKILEDGIARYGARAFSPSVIRRWEEAAGVDIRAPGFPAAIADDEPEAPGYEVRPPRG